MRVDAEQKRMARERNHATWSLTIDGGTKQPQEGRFEICGPLPPEQEAELKALVQRWTTEKKV